MQATPPLPARVGSMKYEIVTMGASLGGFDALCTILGALPQDFCLPVVLAQHQSEVRSVSLVPLLQSHSHLPVREPDDKEPIVPGWAYLAPAGYHLLVDRGAFALSTDEPVHYARPSIDVLFESAAQSYGAAVIGVALTSSTTDGVQGLHRIKRAGGMVLVQDPTLAQSPVLVNAVLASIPVDRVLPLRKIGPFLSLMCQSRQRSPQGS